MERLRGLKLRIESRDQSPIVGIDLGTTNSLVAIVRDGTPVVLESRDGGHLVPSVVTFPDDAGAQPVVGYAAKRRRSRDAGARLFSVKRLLGRSFADVEPGFVSVRAGSGRRRRSASSSELAC